MIRAFVQGGTSGGIAKSSGSEGCLSLVFIGRNNQRWLSQKQVLGEPAILVLIMLRGNMNIPVLAIELDQPMALGKTRYVRPGARFSGLVIWAGQGVVCAG